jgi:hypothetical protein
MFMGRGRKRKLLRNKKPITSTMALKVWPQWSSSIDKKVNVFSTRLKKS